MPRRSWRCDDPAKHRDRASERGSGAASPDESAEHRRHSACSC